MFEEHGSDFFSGDRQHRARKVLDEPGAKEAGVKKLVLVRGDERIAAGDHRNFSSGETIAKECLQIICCGCPKN